MANHKSALKRIRQTARKAAHNRYYHKTTRNAVRKLRGTTDVEDAKNFILANEETNPENIIENPFYEVDEYGQFIGNWD